MSSNPTMAGEDELRHALAQVPQILGKPVELRRINGGITNMNWLVTVGSGEVRYFAKVPGHNTEVFIDRELAHEAAVLAAKTGYGPEVIYVAPDGGLEVHEFLEGYRSCTVADMLDADVRGNVARAYRSLHSAGTLSRTMTGFDQLRERLAQARHHGARLPKDIDHLLWQCGRAQAAITAAGIDPCLCFNDGYVTNYMVDEHKQVKIIDWEYAANNDAYWDLALFAAENFFEGTDTMREILEIHDGSYTRQGEARVCLYYAVAYTTWGLWSSLQAKLSSLPFDFAKYSELLHLRARHHMASSRWEQALLSV